MKLIAPEYYGAFRCIADKCRHSCCIGWEIDVDDASLARYRAMTGPFAARLRAAIEDGTDDAPAHFRLGEKERCPLLNGNGLCDLITECGEDALCQICADHPRFRNFYADRTEIGLGLCCEAAAMLVLSQEGPMALTVLEDDGQDDPADPEEQALLAFRAECIAVMQDRGLPIDLRLESLCSMADTAGFVTPDAALLRPLNRLDPTWDEALDLLGGEWDVLPQLETAFEQFGAYLLYRHLPGALEDGDECGRVRFCVLGVRTLMALCCAHRRKYGECSLRACADYARMYSSEVEYDGDNVDALLDALSDL